MSCDNCGCQYFDKIVDDSMKSPGGLVYTYSACSECEKPVGEKTYTTFVGNDPGDQAVS